MQTTEKKKNVIDICNEFLFVKLEFIAFMSLLQNNHASIPLNLLIKNKAKKKNDNKKHSHKIFFNMHFVTSRNKTNKTIAKQRGKTKKIYNPFYLVS